MRGHALWLKVADEILQWEEDREVDTDDEPDPKDGCLSQSQVRAFASQVWDEQGCYDTICEQSYIQHLLC